MDPAVEQENGEKAQGTEDEDVGSFDEIGTSGSRVEGKDNHLHLVVVRAELVDGIGAALRRADDSDK